MTAIAVDDDGVKYPHLVLHLSGRSYADVVLKAARLMQRAKIPNHVVDQYRYEAGHSNDFLAVTKKWVTVQ